MTIYPRFAARRAIFLLFVCMSLLFCVSPAVSSDTIYVDDNAPNDPGPGTPLTSDPLEDGTTTHPYDAVQEGIDTAVSGDVVMILEGAYRYSGNMELDFGGKAITVRSADGPWVTAIDCERTSYGFSFENGEGHDSVVRGLTIRKADGVGGAIRCNGASPTITDCVITLNNGSGIHCTAGSAPLILGNLITGNLGHNNGGGIHCNDSSPTIIGNIISDNFADNWGGGIVLHYDSDATLINNLIINNGVNVRGAGLTVHESSPTISGCTFSGNVSTQANTGGAIEIYENDPHTVTIVDCILWDDSPLEINIYGPGSADVSYSDVMGGWTGTGNINSAPLFAGGQWIDHCLSQTASGQASDSPCLDAGSDLAANICFPVFGGTICLDEMTTRTDRGLDSGTADMGFHTPPYSILQAGYTCDPYWGTVPFSTTMRVEMENSGVQTRRFAARINSRLANGTTYSNWKSGFTNVPGGTTFITQWSQPIPAVGSVIGSNIFTFLAEDVTPPPFNLPPYPPSGDTDTEVCTVTGMAP